jgi:hypothetical protein
MDKKMIKNTEIVCYVVSNSKMSRKDLSGVAITKTENMF